MKKKEYIERGSLITSFIRFAPEQYTPLVELLIEKEPAADVAEVVRCKDCKRSGMYAFGCGEQEHLACLEIEEDGFVRMAFAVNDDDFCSRGERKEE